MGKHKDREPGPVPQKKKFGGVRRQEKEGDGRDGAQLHSVSKLALGFASSLPFLCSMAYYWPQCMPYGGGAAERVGCVLDKPVILCRVLPLTLAFLLFCVCIVEDPACHG